MKHIAKLACFVCAVALAAALAGCAFFKGETGASSAAQSGAASGEAAGTVSKYGSVEAFDYENFAYSDYFDENGYWKDLHALDYVTLPDDYANVPVAAADVTPTDDEVQAQIDLLLNQNAASVQVTNRAAANGDTVNIDYSGSVDGVAFTGGTAAGYDLILGSNTFIEGFEAQIIGHMPGETFDVNVTFPEGYRDSTDAAGNTVKLSGTAAVFSVTLNYISETITPELTDEWVEGSYGESKNVHTVEQLRAYISDMLYKSSLQSHVINYLLENSSFTELPKQVTDYQVMQCLSYYSNTAQFYSCTLDDFAKTYMGYADADAMLADMDADIDTYSKEALIYQAVAEAENITPTQEQIDVYADYTDAYGENYCRMVAMMDAVIARLIDGAAVS